MGLKGEVNETDKERGGEYKREGRKLEGQSKINKGRMYRCCNIERNKDTQIRKIAKNISALKSSFRRKVVCCGCSMI